MYSGFRFIDLLDSIQPDIFSVCSQDDEGRSHAVYGTQRAQEHTLRTVLGGRLVKCFSNKENCKNKQNCCIQTVHYPTMEKEQKLVVDLNVWNLRNVTYLQIFKKVGILN
jgi:hypothetical protein